MLWNEMVYIVNDLCKLYSDDTSLNEDHIIFLLSLHRAYLLKSTYSTITKTIPESNYQTVCLDMAPRTNVVCINTHECRSKEKVPNMMEIGSKMLYPAVGVQFGNMTMVNMNRFKYVSINPYLRNVIYGMIAPDGYLYVKSSNDMFKYVEQINIRAIFEDPQKAALVTCNSSCYADGGSNNDNVRCDVMDQQFPLEDALLPVLVQAVVKDMVGAAYRPSDKKNDANDELDDIAKMIASYAKKDFNNAVRANEQQ